MTLDLETTRRAFNDMFTGFGKTLSNQIGDCKELGQDLWKSVRDGWNNTVKGNELKPIEIPKTGVSASPCRLDGKQN